MNGTPREKILLVLFPSIMIALVWWGWLRPNRQMADVTRSLTNAKKAAMQPAEITRQQKETTDLQSKRADAEEQQKQLHGHWKELRGTFAVSAEPSHTMDQIAEVLRKHELKWVNGAAVRGGFEGDSGRRLQQLIDKLNSPAPTGSKASVIEGRIDYSAVAPESSPRIANSSTVPKGIWKIEFAGSYGDVLAAMHTLGQELPQVIPLQIQMRSANPALKMRLWTLVFLI